MSKFYRAGVGSIGAMMFDQQLKRLEGLKTSTIADAGKLLAQADQTARRVSAALIVSAVVTGVSTVVLVKKAMGKDSAR